MSLRLSFLLLCGIAHAVALAQVRDRFGSDLLPDGMRQDLNRLRATIASVHPDPYRYHSAEALDSAFEAVYTKVATPLSAARFQDLLPPLVNMLGDRNFHMPDLWPSTETPRQDLPLLPLNVSILEGGLYVESEPKGFRSIPRGSRILAINGLDADTILHWIGRSIPTDGANETYRWRRIEQGFPEYFHRHVDRSTVFQVRFMDEQGQERIETVNAMTRVQMSMMAPGLKSEQPSWGYQFLDDIGTCWLTIGSLEPDPSAGMAVPMTRYIATLLKELEQHGTRQLVVDVRGAGGSDPAIAELVFAAMALTPFRMFRTMSMRSITQPDQLDVQVPGADYYAQAKAGYEPKPDGMHMLRRDDVRLQPVDPVRRAFKGRVYVVCDGLTRDAGAVLVMLAKRQGRARIIGEEVGSNALSFNGGRNMVLTLPHSGIRVMIPLVRYEPDGDLSGPADRGELPHHRVERRPGGLAQGRDTIREAMLMLIRERQ